MTDITAEPFDWNDNLSKEALEDFEGIRKDLPYCICQNIGMALAKLELLEKQGCKVIDPSGSSSEKTNKCDDAISRQELLNGLANIAKAKARSDAQKSLMGRVMFFTEKLPSVNPQKPKIGHCKDCKYFEYDSMAKVDGVPLIMAHEICSKWGDGCKTSENGYCFLFESKEGSET